MSAISDIGSASHFPSDTEDFIDDLPPEDNPPSALPLPSPLLESQKNLGSLNVIVIKKDEPPKSQDKEELPDPNCKERPIDFAEEENSGIEASFLDSVLNTLSWLGDKCKKTGSAAKDGVVYGVHYYTEHHLRPDDEKFLRELTGENQIRNTLSAVMPELCDFIELLFPELLEKIAERNHSAVRRIAENFILHVLANFGRELFPEGSGCEKISLEDYVERIGFFILEIIEEHLVQIDQDVERGSPLTSASFIPLAECLLNIALPKDQDSLFSQLLVLSEKTITKSLTIRPLANFLLMIYTKLILRKKTAEASRFDNLTEEQKLKLASMLPLVKQGIGFLMKASANHFIETEDSFFRKLTESEEISDFISYFLSPVIDRIICLIPPVFWNFVPQNQECLKKFAVSLVIKIIGNLARKLYQEEQEEQKTVFLGEVVEKVLLYLIETCDAGYREIAERRLLNKNIKPKHFLPLANSLISLAMPDNAALFQLLGRRFPDLIEVICELLFEFDAALQQKDIKEDKQKLRVLLWDPKKIKAEQPALKNIPETTTKELSIAFGTERLVKQLYGLCKGVSELLVISLESLLGEVEPILEILLKSFPELENYQAAEEILIGFSDVFSNEGESVSKILKLCEKTITRLLFKGGVLALEKGRKGQSGKVLLVEALKNILDICCRHFPVIRGNLRNLKADYRTAAEHPQIFIPLSEDLLHFFLSDGDEKGLGFQDYLPVPAWLRKPLGHCVSHQLLPFVLGKAYQESLSWLGEVKKNNKQKLQKFYGSKKPGQACLFVARFSQEFVPYFLRNNNEVLTSVILQFVKEQAPGIFDRMDGGDEIGPLLNHLFKFIGETDYSNLKKAWGFLGKYIEAALLKGFADFSEIIFNLEIEYSKDLHKCHEGGLALRAALLNLQLSTRHFQRVNEVKDALNEKHASRVEDALMLQKFKEHNALHAAMDPDLDSKAFFKNKAQEILSFIEWNSLPVPQFLQKKIWILFENHLFPLIFEALVVKIRDPQTIHAILLGCLRQINQTFDSSKEGVQDQIDLPDDHLQREIAQECGDLVEGVVGLQPSKIAQQFLRYRSIREKVGEAMAKVIRSKIERYTFLELIELMIETSLPLLHPGGGEWSREQIKNGECLAPKDEDSPEDNFIPFRINSAGKKTIGWSFDFPKDQEAVKTQKRRNRRKFKKAAADLEKELSGMIAHQTKLTIQEGFKGMWKDFQKNFDHHIEKNFHEYGLRVKHVFDLIFRGLFIYAIKPALKLAMYPFYRLIWVLMNFYFKYQSKLRIEDIESKIHGTLIMKVIESFLALLEERKDKVSLAKTLIATKT